MHIKIILSAAFIGLTVAAPVAVKRSDDFSVAIAQPGLAVPSNTALIRRAFRCQSFTKCRRQEDEGEAVDKEDPTEEVNKDEEELEKRAGSCKNSKKCIRQEIEDAKVAEATVEERATPCSNPKKCRRQAIEDVKEADNAFEKRLTSCKDPKKCKY